MFFKNWFTGACVLATLFGCAKQNTADHHPIQVQLKGSGDCISNIGTEASNYTSGKASVAEINAFWTCMTSSIQEFERITVGDGANGDQYSAAAIREFINHYFYTTRYISDPVLAGMMQIKRVVLGGDEKVVSRTELDQLTQLFGELNAITVALQPDAAIIFRKKTNATDDQIRHAGASLQTALLRLGTWLNNKNQSYSFQALTQSANAIAQWSQVNGKDTATMHTIRQAAFVLPEAKSILIGGNQLAIDGHDWQNILNVASRGFYTFLAAANGFDVSLDSALNRTILPETASVLVNVIAQSAAAHPNGVITQTEFKNLFLKLAQTDWLPTSMDASGLSQLWTWFLKRPLGDGKTEPAGLTVAQVGLLQQQLNNWLTLLNTPAQDPNPYIQDFNKNLAASTPISWDSTGRMIYPVQLPTSWSEDARRHMVWPYVIIRWLKESYVGAAVATLGPDQMTLAAQEILPLLQNFGWLKTTKVTIGKRILREADLFTLASNGDGLLDLNEAVRYLAFIASSYRAAQVWLNTATSTCGGTQVDCVRSLALKPSTGVLASMPRLQGIIATWKPGQFVAYMQHAEQTVLDAPESGNFTTGDLLQTWQLMGYIEVFVELYDTAPRDDLINLAEASTALNVYGPTLERLLSGSGLGQAETKAFFTFMMKYGDTPFTMFGGQIAYNYWRWHPDTWAFTADRDTLMSILNQLSKL